MIRLLSVCILLFLGIHWSSAQLSEADADALVVYGENLGLTGAARLGKEGVTIEGESISGTPVRRPSEALARAAEIYAELAVQKSDFHLLAKAFVQWETINTWDVAVPYLRMFSRNFEKGSDFSIYCKAKLAETYERLGDVTSADETYVLLESLEPTSGARAYALAATARRKLKTGQLAEAESFARKAMTGIDPNKFGHGLESLAYPIAMAVLRQIPNTKPVNVAANGETPAQTANNAAGDNPRTLFEQGRILFEKKDYTGAIEKFTQYRQRFPATPAAIQAALNTAIAYEQLDQPENATKAYTALEVQYPDSPESCEATIRESRKSETGGNLEDAINQLKSGITRSRIPANQANLTAALAKLYLRAKRSEAAALTYIELLSKYSRQDAAKDALEALKNVSTRLEDSKAFIVAIQTWLTQGSSAQNAALSHKDKSAIRRLVLGFYADRMDVGGGKRWLDSFTGKTDSLEGPLLVRDEAWLNAQACKAASRRAGSMQPRDIEKSMDWGLNAWRLAPNTREGISGIEAAFVLAMDLDLSKKDVKELELALIKIAETNPNDDTDKMLASYYRKTGDSRNLARVQDRIKNR